MLCVFVLPPHWEDIVEVGHSTGKELGDCATGIANAIKGRCRKKAGYGMRGFSVTAVHVMVELHLG